MRSYSSIAAFEMRDSSLPTIDEAHPARQGLDEVVHTLRERVMAAHLSALLVKRRLAMGQTDAAAVDGALARIERNMIVAAELIDSLCSERGRLK